MHPPPPPERVPGSSNPHCSGRMLPRGVKRAMPEGKLHLDVLEGGLREEQIQPDGPFDSRVVLLSVALVGTSRIRVWIS